MPFSTAWRMSPLKMSGPLSAAMAMASGTPEAAWAGRLMPLNGLTTTSGLARRKSRMSRGCSA